MAGPVWFVSLEETTVISEFLKNYNLPFDVDFVIAQIFSNNSAFLHEAYRASLKHPVRVLPFGKWSAGNGLTSPPHISLYYRRNDFEGVEFKVATTEVSISYLNNIVKLQLLLLHSNLCAIESYVPLLDSDFYEVRANERYNTI